MLNPRSWPGWNRHLVNSTAPRRQHVVKCVLNPRYLPPCRGSRGAGVLIDLCIIDSEIYKTIPIQFPRCFSLFYEKNSTLFSFLVKCLQSNSRKARGLQVASAYKRQEFWRKTHTPLWLLIGRIIFLTLEKTSFAIVIGLFFFFVRVKNIVRSSDWLELICVWGFVIYIFSEYVSQYVYTVRGGPDTV